MSDVSTTGEDYAQAIQAFRDSIKSSEPSSPVIVDFDETLWLRNSTEEFLDNIGPKLYVAPLLAVIEIVKPWRLMRLFGFPRERASFVARDWFRLVIVLVLAPWSIIQWRQQAPALAIKYTNSELLDILRSLPETRVIVATFSMDLICRPLIKALLPDCRLISMPLATGPKMRTDGKLKAIQKAVEGKNISSAIFLTDHADHDRDVIAAIPRSFVARSPEALFLRACANDYVPFRYTLAGKHAGRNHVLRVFLGEDFVALALATLPVIAMPLITGLAYLFLIISFFIIFEIGYHENDKLGAEREEAPILTKARLTQLGIMSQLGSWLWGLLFAIPGLCLIIVADVSQWPTSNKPAIWFVILFLAWLFLLILARLIFAVFNRVNERTRATLYLPLQMCKGILIIWVLSLPLHPAGLALILAIPISRWLPYVVYRYGGERKSTPDRIFPHADHVFPLCRNTSCRSVPVVVARW